MKVYDIYDKKTNKCIKKVASTGNPFGDMFVLAPYLNKEKYDIQPTYDVEIKKEYVN